MTREYIKLVVIANGQQELHQVGGIIDELMKRAENAGVSVDDLTEQLKNLNTEAGQTTNYDGVITKFKQIAGITAIGMGIKKSINIFTAFDDVARKVQATTGATASVMKELRDEAKKLGSTTSWSASEAAEAQFEFAKAGFTTSEILEANAGILNTATAGQLGLAEATEITAGALRSFGLNANQSGYVGDMLAKTASSASTDIRLLHESLKYAGVGAQTFGLDMKSTLGILGQLANLSLKGSQAGTSLQAVFSTLMNKQKQKILIDTGINLTEDGKFRNLLDIIEDIKKKTSEMEDSQAKSFLSSVFGEVGSQAINRLMKVNKSDLEKMISDIGNSNGFSQKMAEIMESGQGGSFRGMYSAIEGLAIAIGETLAPAVIFGVKVFTNLISTVTSVINYLNSSSTVAKILKGCIEGLVATYIIYKAHLIAVTYWNERHIYLEKAKQIVMTISNSLLAITNGLLGILSKNLTISTLCTWGLNTAMAVLTSPITLIIGGLAILGAGFYFLYKKSEKFRTAINFLLSPLKKLWEWIQKFSFVKKIIDVGKTTFNNIKTAFGFGENKDIEINHSLNKNIKTTFDKPLDNIKTGSGINTDYLLVGNESKKKHNGYYLKGTKSTNSGNIYTDSSSIANSDSIYTSSSIVEKSIDEKLLDTLIAIKNILSSKNTNVGTTSNNSQVVINLKKGRDFEEAFPEFIDDLIVALGNI